MTVNPRSRHTTASLALEAIYQHRLLTTDQLRQLLAPRTRPRWMQSLSARLQRDGLVASVQRQGMPPGGQQRVWFATPRGADVVEAMPTRVEMRRRLVTPDLALGRIQAHTLAVNDVGLAFCRAARQRGDDFGPLSWRQEIGHQLSPARRQPDMLVTDAVLRYWQWSKSGQARLHYRFLELDRANLLLDDLGAKIAAYARLHRLWTEHMERPDESRLRWPSMYGAFPNLLVVLANPDRANLQRRAEGLLGLCRANPQLQACPSLRVYVCLFEDLVQLGPFAPIFRRPHDERYVNWLGESVQEIAAGLSPAA